MRVFSSDGYDNDILIEGGIWGPENPPAPIPNVTLIATPTSISFSTGTTFVGDFHTWEVLTITWSSGSAKTGRFQVTSINLPTRTLTLQHLSGDTLPPGTTSITASITTLPPGGHMFRLRSNRGVIRGVNLVNHRGIQFQLWGDDFRIGDCASRLPAADTGGGLIFRRGRRMRGWNMSLEAHDDVFQFDAELSEDANDVAVLDDCSIVDSTGTSGAGALVVFLSGLDTVEADTVYTRVTNCYAGNIRGTVGGSPTGGFGLKFNCANSMIPMENCWAENIAVTHVQTDHNGKAAIRLVAGRAESGVLNCGVRASRFDNRPGPLLLMERAPVGGVGKRVDFTVEGVVASRGAETQPGTPLLSLLSADRLVFREIAGELSAGASGIDPGRAIVAADVEGEAIGELVIDGLRATEVSLAQAALVRLGTVGRGSISRLRLSRATGFTSPIYGLRLITPGSDPGPRNVVFDQTDFRDSTVPGDRPIDNWVNNAGNDIVHSINFDDDTTAISFASAGTKTITPDSWASVVRLAGSATTTVTVNAMTASPSGSPERTLLVCPYVTIDKTGSTNFVMGASLSGGTTIPTDRAITFRWRPDIAKWQEVARYG